MGRTQFFTADRTSEVKHHFRGTHRLVPPEITWNRIRPLFPACGITRVADVTGLDDVGIPVHQAIRPWALTLSVSQGKGQTHMLAKVSAAMEAIELHHAENLLLPPSRGTASDIGPLSYRLDQLTLLPRSLLNDDLVLDWIAAVTIPGGTPTLVPRSFVEMSSLVRRCWEPPVFATTSNGLASGNGYTEAVLHGICEVVERDCIAEFHRRDDDERTSVCLDTIDDPDCQSLLDLFAQARNEIFVYDAMNKLGIPCFQVEAWSPALPLIFGGWGCHLDPAIALSRALTEAAQGRLTTISGTRDDLVDGLYDLQQESDFQVRPAFVAGRSADFRAYKSLATSSVDSDVLTVAERIIDKTGVEPIVADLSYPGEPIAVVKVVTPGLSFDDRHAIERPQRGQR